MVLGITVADVISHMNTFAAQAGLLIVVPLGIIWGVKFLRGTKGVAR